MTGDLHVRCSKCHCHIAGPLSHVESTKQIVADGDFAVGLNEFFTIGEIQFPTSHLFNFTFESAEDLFIHPQWYEGWRRDWPDYAQGATQRRLFAVARGSGCCGPQGTVHCSCGVQLGCVIADCIGSQWMVIFDSRIDRSDQHDGHWVLHADTTAPIQWYEDSGELIGNRRNGPWERWLVVPHTVSVKRRNKNREPVTAQEERLERQLVASSEWADGKLICEVAG